MAIENCGSLTFPDILGRTVAQKLSEAPGEQVVVTSAAGRRHPQGHISLEE